MTPARCEPVARPRSNQHDYWCRPSLLTFLTAIEDGTYTLEDAIHLGFLAACRQYNDRLTRFLTEASKTLNQAAHREWRG